MEPWQNAEEEEFEEELTLAQWKKRDKNRDNYFRCKQCGQLWHHKQCILDDKSGYQCPNNCVEAFEQPQYESPLNE